MILRPIDYACLGIYFLFVLAIGWMVRCRIHTSEDFLTSGHSVPVWITSLAFIAANLGAQEMIGMCASGAKYGIMTAQFYWLGAVPAMIFVGLLLRAALDSRRLQSRRMEWHFETTGAGDDAYLEIRRQFESESDGSRRHQPRDWARLRVSELHSLVYGVAAIPQEAGISWYKRPVPLAIAVGVILIIMNVLFW